MAVALFIHSRKKKPPTQLRWLELVNYHLRLPRVLQRRPVPRRRQAAVTVVVEKAKAKIKDSLIGKQGGVGRRSYIGGSSILFNNSAAPMVGRRRRCYFIKQIHFFN